MLNVLYAYVMRFKYFSIRLIITKNIPPVNPCGLIKTSIMTHGIPNILTIVVL